MNSNQKIILTGSLFCLVYLILLVVHLYVYNSIPQGIEVFIGIVVELFSIPTVLMVFFLTSVSLYQIILKKQFNKFWYGILLCNLTSCIIIFFAP